MIISYQEAADYIGAEVAVSDPLLKDAVDDADRIVKTYCGRNIEGGSYTEFLRGFGSRTAFLKEDPVVSITELRVDRSGVLGSDTVVDLTGVWTDRNQLYYPGFFPEGPHVARVVYVGGYYPSTDVDPTHTKTPADLKRVVKRLAARLWRMQSGGAAVDMRSESVGDYSYQQWDEMFSPLDRGVLENYKRYSG